MKVNKATHEILREDPTKRIYLVPRGAGDWLFAEGRLLGPPKHRKATGEAERRTEGQ